MKNAETMAKQLVLALVPDGTTAFQVTPLFRKIESLVANALTTFAAQQMAQVTQERDELRVQLTAWQSAFGSQQLTHAKDAYDQALRKADQAKRETWMEAAKRLCLHCRHGIPLEQHGGILTHYIESSGSVFSGTCNAEEFRRRAQEIGMSYQYHQQCVLKQNRKCTRCWKPRNRNASYCDVCAVKVRINQRARLNCKPWKRGHPGRPPLTVTPSASPRRPHGHDAA